MQTPLGFSFAGVPAGLKPVRRDVALIVSDVPCAAAGAFTTNLAASAPVLDARPRVPAAGIRAVVVNSGNANALTGPAGVRDVVAIREAFAAALGIGADAILTASTGVIGAKLPVGKVAGAAGKLVAALSAAPEPAAEAIMTTDTRTKLAARTLVLGGREVTISAIAKGSGMIAPQLATLIAIITTDVAIAPALLDRALHAAIEPSFHCLVVDGDTSTNDTVLVLANGRAGNPVIADPGPDFDAFARALLGVCVELARDVASDGEGATRLLEVCVGGAPSVASARDLARSIAASSLVKAAIFGADPNWGRILATVGARCGSQGYAVDLARATVAIQGVPVFAGEPVLADPPALRAKMRAPEVRIDVTLAAGEGAATAWGCDLGYDYVKLNADYTSLIVQTADGQLAKDDRLTNYSPTFKRTLLVEALSYISRFAGTRCVVVFRGAAMAKPALAQAFCKDIELLRSCGLQPIVVHGHAPQNLVRLLELEGAKAIGLSAGVLRTQGALVAVDRGAIEALLGQSYVPVVAPTARGEDGMAHPIEPDAAAAALAVALGAPKLILLADGAGITEHGELVTDLTAAQLAAQDMGGIAAQAIRDALAGGVGRVHVIDGRTPHSLIAELFTDRGVGTLVTQ
jgi:glutamate N-acetyltransferase / amino-acid N-acetyltransferase/acetylglutamate kinase